MQTDLPASKTAANMHVHTRQTHNLTFLTLVISKRYESRSEVPGVLSLTAGRQWSTAKLITSSLFQL